MLYCSELLSLVKVVELFCFIVYPLHPRKIFFCHFSLFPLISFSSEFCVLFFFYTLDITNWPVLRWPFPLPKKNFDLWHWGSRSYIIVSFWPNILLLIGKHVNFVKKTKLACFKWNWILFLFVWHKIFSQVFFWNLSQCF